MVYKSQTGDSTLATCLFVNVIVYGSASVDKIRGEHGTNMGKARLGKVRFLGDVLQCSDKVTAL